MAWYNEESSETLNFIVAGGYFAGHELLQQALSKHPSIVCHGDVLNADEEVRQAVHESYFGDSRLVPDWYQRDTLSVEQYLSNKIFDNAIHDEQAIGVRVNYHDIIENDLLDYFQDKCRRGDFCLLHVVRNPVACFFDYLSCHPQDNRTFCSVVDLLVTFVRKHTAAESKINRAFDDRLVIPYHELLLDFKGSLRSILKYLERPFNAACVPTRSYAGTQSMRSRVDSWSQLKEELPQDVLDAITSPTLL